MAEPENLAAPGSGAASSVRPSIVVLVAVSAIGPLALNIFMPSMPGLQREFGVPYATVQLTLTLYLIGMAICQLVYGPLSDRFGRRPVLLGGLVLYVAASLVCAAAPTIEVLVAGRLAQAAGGSAGMVLSRAIVRDLYDRDKAASVIGYVTAGWVVAPLVAPTIGGLLDMLFGWRASFVFVTGAGALALAAAVARLHETNYRRQAGAGLLGLVRGFVLLLRSARFNGYAMQLALTSSVFFCFLAGAPYVVVEVLHRSPVEYGLWFTLVSVGYMAGNALAGRFSERHGVDRMITFGTAISLAGAAMGAAAAALGILSPAMLFLPMLVISVGNGLSVANGTAGAVSVNPGLAGAAAGLAGFLQTGFGSLAAQAVGAMQPVWPTAVVWVMLAGAAGAILVHAMGPARAAPTAIR